MKVAIVGPAPPLRGGIALHSEGLIAALARRGHRSAVFSYRRLYPALLFPGSSEREVGGGDGDAGSGGATEDLLGSPVARELDTLRPGSWRQTARAVAEFGPDVVVFQWWHPIVAPALLEILRSAAAGVAPARSLVICHNALPHERFPAARRLARSVFAGSDAVLCHSDAVARDVRGLLGTGGTRPSVHSVELPVLTDDARAPGREQARRRLGVAPGERLALFVGHIRAYKGVELLARAWSEAAPGLPAGARLMVAGEPYGRRRRLERRLRSASGVCRVSFEFEYLTFWKLKCWMIAADVLCLPYLRATQSGLAPLAAALGVPMIVSSAGGLAERADAGSDPPGLVSVVRAGDRSALARALVARLSRPTHVPSESADGRAASSGSVPAGERSSPAHAEAFRLEPDVAIADRALSERLADAVERSWRPTIEVFEALVRRNL